MDYEHNPNFESSFAHATADNLSPAVALASVEVNNAIRAIRKSAFVEDLKFERLAVRQTDTWGGIVDGLVLFACKVRASLPAHRRTIWLPVYIRSGEVQRCIAFRDSSDREYALSDAEIKRYLGVGLNSYLQVKRQTPVERSITDRTVLPTLPSRNFFSLAKRREGRSYDPEADFRPLESRPFDTWSVAVVGEGDYRSPNHYIVGTYLNETMAQERFDQELSKASPGDDIFMLKNSTDPVKKVRAMLTTEGERLFIQQTLSGEILLVDANKNLIGRFNSIEEAEQWCNEYGYQFTVKAALRLGYSDSSTPSFDAVNDQSEERWVDHMDPTTSCRSSVGMVMGNALDGDMTLTVDGEDVDPDDLSGWATYMKTEPTEMVQMDEDFTVDTLEGPMNADAGDYLAIGPEGEMYPVDREIQEQTYEEV